MYIPFAMTTGNLLIPEWESSETRQVHCGDLWESCEPTVCGNKKQKDLFSGVDHQNHSAGCLAI